MNIERESMNKRLKILLLLILIIFGLKILLDKFPERYKYTDEYIARNISADIGMLQDIINETYNEILFDGKYKDYSVEELQKLVKNADDRIFDFVHRIESYGKLNNNFWLSLSPLLSITDNIEDTLNNGSKLSEAEIKLVKEIIIINQEYTELRKTYNYRYDKNIFTKMNQPELLKEYVDEIGRIEKEYEELIQ